MARYLVVAHQTAQSPELVSQLLALADEDQAAEFVVLVPQTPVSHLLVWVEGQARQVALARARAARQHLEEAGLTVVDERVGDRNPLDAVAAELAVRPGYAAIVICTLPAGLSRWLKFDVISQARRMFRDRRIVHVAASPSDVVR